MGSSDVTLNYNKYVYDIIDLLFLYIKGIFTETYKVDAVFIVSCG